MVWLLPRPWSDNPWENPRKSKKSSEFTKKKAEMPELWWIFVDFPRNVIRIRMIFRNSIHNAPARKVSNFRLGLCASLTLFPELAWNSLPVSLRTEDLKGTIGFLQNSTVSCRFCEFPVVFCKDPRLRNAVLRWPGDSQHESVRFAQIDSQKNFSFHNVRAIRATRLKPAIRNF